MQKLDQQHFDLFCKLPIFAFHNFIKPDNEAAQKQAFFATGKNPIFSYPKAQAFDVAGYLKTLESVGEQMNELQESEWIHKLYKNKLNELMLRGKLVDAVAKADDEQVKKIAIQLWGETDAQIDQLEQELEQMTSADSPLHTLPRSINADVFTDMVQKTLDQYNLQNWKIIPTDHNSIKVSRGRTGKMLRIHIPKSLHITKARAERLIKHEIEVHTLRTQNGVMSPLHILRIGTDRYLATDEGLALWHQSDKTKKFDPSFWGTYACAIANKHDFAQTFKILLQARIKLDQTIGREPNLQKQKDRTWKICTRAFRGITNPNKPNLATGKDHIYRTGLEVVREYLGSDGEINKLFAGNIGLQDIDVLESINLEYVQIPRLK